MDPVYHFNFKLLDITSLPELSDNKRTLAIIQHNSLSNFAREPTFVPALDPKRMAISARRTGPLHNSGLLEIKDKVKQKLMADPSLHGFSHHYNRMACWGAESRSQQAGLGFTLSSLIVRPSVDDADHLVTSPLGDVSEGAGDCVPSPTMFPPKLSQCLQVTDDPLFPSLNPSEESLFARPDFSKYTFPTRTEDKRMWPPPNPKAITSRKSLAEMMMTHHVVQLLSSHGLIPVIVSPNPRDLTQCVHSPFGPLLDSRFQPCEFGTRFLASVIYNKYRLKKGKGFNDAWNHDVSVASTCIFRLPEKNGLPVDVPVIAGSSPLGEMMRIVDKQERLGFNFFGSGGVPVVNGFVSPSANSRAATDLSGGRDGATFETAQTVANKANYTMDQLCERGTPIAMFVAGKALPRSFYDSVLAPGEQAFYLGTYRVEQCAQEPPLETADINAMCTFYREHYDLDNVMLRFHLDFRKKYRAVPVFYERRENGYSHLQVDKRDDRKPLFEVKQGSSYQVLLSTQAVDFISEKDMIACWIADGGHLELIDYPYQPPVAANMAVDTATRDGGERTVIHPLRLATSTIRPLVKRMAHQAKRKITFRQHWDILLKCGVASFARLLRINVDADGKIGPLIDSCPRLHTAGSELTNYSHYFGTQGSLKFMDMVGPELQKSPTTHPIRSYDPKVLWLMLCNGGGQMRVHRPGLSWIEEDPRRGADIFFQCVIVEVVKVQVLIEWTRCFYPTLPERLPILEDIPDFLKFVDSILLQSSVESTNGLIQEQYEVSTNFNDRGAFSRFFLYLASDLEPWLSRLVPTIKDYQGESLFSNLITRLSTFINSNDGLGSTMCTKSPFQCQHILMNVNELVDNFPTGIPTRPVIGFGGSFGAQLLQEATFLPANKLMVETTMKSLLARYNKGSVAELTILGLKQELIDGKPSVCVSINSRPLTVCDPEHGCCMSYYFYERKPGCTKGAAANPKLVFSHCHPIPTATFPSDEASDSIYMFAELVESDKWNNGKSAGSDSEEHRAVAKRNRRTLPTNASNSGKRKSVTPLEIYYSDSGSENPGCDNEDEASMNMFVGADDGGRDQRGESEASPLPFTEVTDLKFRRNELQEYEESIVLQSKKCARNNLCTEDQNGDTDSCVVPAHIMPPVLVLLNLGMIFGRMKGTPKEISTMDTHTEQLRRDTARCIMAETCSGKEVFTIDCREGDADKEGCVYRPDRHLIQDINSLDKDDDLFARMNGRVSQITLDYFWFSGRYWDTQALRNDFYSCSIPWLAGLLVTGGAIYMGLCPQLFIRLLTHEAHWKDLLHLSLVHAEDVGEIDLVRGSHLIPQELYEKNLLGKKDQKPEVALGTSASELRQTMSAHLGKPGIPRRFDELVCEHVNQDCRAGSFHFMKLAKII